MWLCETGPHNFEDSFEGSDRVRVRVREAVRMTGVRLRSWVIRDTYEVHKTRSRGMCVCVCTSDFGVGVVFGSRGEEQLPVLAS